ncbi:MCP four helix bundle domain-containing protein [Olivibacter sp. XZL3]|uniref:MCP four helix bundle domain-containing protein n=1 Tax=Olivibacter sp. XZL3 TaxID=1735116 RepID=UPI0010654C88|nr:MCP four helix bundle domain-containing protein [Olivibacter sp. XZL3]
MRWTYFIRQKLKVAFLLFCIMACSVLIRVLEDKNVKSISKALLSMYDDRLVPASDIFYMTEHLYAKKFLIFQFLNDSTPSTTSLAQLAKRMEQHNRLIDSLLNKYEKTYLVDQEKRYLEEFKKQLNHYIALEGQFFKDSSLGLSQRIATYKTDGGIALDRTLERLSALERLQTQVGRDLMSDAQFVMSGTRFFSTLQLILSIVIGIMVVVLVLESKSVIKKKQPFDLN